MGWGGVLTQSGHPEIWNAWSNTGDLGEVQTEDWEEGEGFQLGTYCTLFRLILKMLESEQQNVHL